MYALCRQTMHITSFDYPCRKKKASIMTQEDLRVPLLDDDAPNDDETALTCSITLELGKKAAKDNKNTKNSDDDVSFSASSWGLLLSIVTMSVLLWTQFKIAFLDATVQTGDWSTIQVTIGLFVVASFLYKNSSTESINSSIVLALMPELVMDVILLLVLLKKPDAAVSLMMIFTIAFSLACALNDCVFMVHFEAEDDTEDDDEEGLDKTQHDSRWATPLVQPVACIAGIPITY